ncbi:MAG: hypothetical protein F2681_13215 [Actinobacteria bacterium]|uniref:Unannotated protein n=1 Tax=freshwater metagenome TaxID=449393 RepID=A0A6J6SSS2_9ZZZZ|nr:hypothetical protein [Actinomycetota bacterium]MSW78600.1 hypothetical protein [Actinomycetota bacterium]MSX54319.1 hypothetical protein [Actinomycetota bacterium]MSZ84092.1 hypothetical protein [Actinomycetota bacterium]MTB19038.1 hypothetical protein [Actinomycetota bacterium]
MMDNDTLDMLRTSLRHVLTEATNVPLADRLGELGWDEVVADDPVTALHTLFTLKGDTVSSADALGPRLAAALADALGDPQLTTATVGMESPFGPSSLTDGSLTVDAVVFTPPSDNPVVVRVDGEHLAVVVGSALTCTRLTTTDGELAQFRLTGTVPASQVQCIEGATASIAWSAMVTHGRWLLACELVGIAQHVTDSAAQYTGERIQYGKPIGTFQALQHRIATAHVLVVGAARLAEHAGHSGDEWSALVAKAVAGQAAETACTQAQQCYGAIGFTWEHEFHHYLRRTYVLDRLLGDWRSLEREIGNELMNSRHVPKIGML